MFNNPSELMDKKYNLYAPLHHFIYTAKCSLSKGPYTKKECNKI